MKIIRAYLRASTKDQDAMRAKNALNEFVSATGGRITSWYVENVSGASLDRPELVRLLNDASKDDILLIEQVDRLSRLNDEDWRALRAAIDERGVKVVSMDLPTSHMALTVAASDAFMDRIINSINNMMLDMLAAIARKDYEDRRRRQTEGIKKAKDAGLYKGKQANAQLHRDIKTMIEQGNTCAFTARLLRCSVRTVYRVKATMDVGE